MRVVGGRHRGRRIEPPKGIEARPTTDFAKEALFNILQHSVPLEGIRVLDLFAGAGGISVEFLSRGAEHVVSVERDRVLYAHLQKLARDLNEPGWQLVKADVFTFLRSHRAKYDIVFADPPFALDAPERIPTLVFETGLLEDDGLLVLEHPASVQYTSAPGFRDHRAYGSVHFSFLEPPRP